MFAWDFGLQLFAHLSIIRKESVYFEETDCEYHLANEREESGDSPISPISQ